MDPAHADRLARTHYERHAPGRWGRYEDYPGRALLVKDAQVWLQACRDAGLTLVEAEDGR